MFVCCCKPAIADLILGFSIDDGGSFANSFDVEVGASLAIGIYLQQTDPDTVLTDDGIVSWGFDLTRAPASLGTISNPSVNPVFDFENHNVTTATGFEWEYSETASSGIKGNAILLGGFQFDSTAKGISLFTVEDRLVGSGVGNASWVTSSFDFLDEEIFGTGAADTYQFSITATSAVPEPSSFVMLSCIAGLAIGRRRRTA
jgi:hypothetical protein